MVMVCNSWVATDPGERCRTKVVPLKSTTYSKFCRKTCNSCKTAEMATSAYAFAMPMSVRSAFPSLEASKESNTVPVSHTYDSSSKDILSLTAADEVSFNIFNLCL